MEAQTLRKPIESHTDPAGAPPIAGISTLESDAARSERNIAEWRAYLPSGCVYAMIKMGWDIST